MRYVPCVSDMRDVGKEDKYRIACLLDRFRLDTKIKPLKDFSTKGEMY